VNKERIEKTKEEIYDDEYIMELLRWYTYRYPSSLWNGGIVVGLVLSLGYLFFFWKNTPADLFSLKDFGVVSFGVGFIVSLVFTFLYYKILVFKIPAEAVVWREGDLLGFLKNQYELYIISPWVLLNFYRITWKGSVNFESLILERKGTVRLERYFDKPVIFHYKSRIKIEPTSFELIKDGLSKNKYELGEFFCGLVRYVELGFDMEEINLSIPKGSYKPDIYDLIKAFEDFCRKVIGQKIVEVLKIENEEEAKKMFLINIFLNQGGINN